MCRKQAFLKPLYLLMAALSMLLLVSCSPERKLAKQFIHQNGAAALLLLAPDYVHKTGYKLPDSLDLDLLSGTERDSVLLASTTILKRTTDSIYLEEFLHGFRNELNLMGFQVYDSKNAIDFLTSGKRALIVNLAQAGLEEFYDSVGASAQFNDEDIYSYDYLITSLNMNFWFEVTGMNKYDSAMHVLFSQQTISDWVEGDFRYFHFSGDVKYIYNVDSLSLNDLYYAAGKVGELNAGYLHDYLMNKYIENHLNYLPQKAFTLDRYTGAIRRLKSWGFTEIVDE
ncbi:MAG: hypothetical protein RBS07_00495 [Lentimicrobium sp.]|jgi:hypothetical protein|nr:hypothetical protein [Lentimicrobium sp.]